MISNHQPFVLHIGVLLCGYCVLITNTARIAILASYLSCQGFYRNELWYHTTPTACDLTWEMHAFWKSTNDDPMEYECEHWCNRAKTDLNTVFVLECLGNSSVNTGATLYHGRTGKLGKGYESWRIGRFWG